MNNIAKIWTKPRIEVSAVSLAQAGGRTTTDGPSTFHIS